MHINTVKVGDFWVSYDIENVNGEIEIVATFTKDGETVHRVYNISEVATSKAETVAHLLDAEFAKTKAKHMIDEANKSKQNPFR